MQKIFFNNTLGKEKQEFRPIREGEVRMYSCGPTVYNVAHIGNLRSYIFADILKRALLYNGYNVRHIINVTDIGHLASDADEGEDKMVKAIRREGKEMTLKAMREIADFYFEKFRWDLKKLNVMEPEEFPFASDHIKEDVQMIQALLDKGFAYTISDGIYFDTSKLPDYGKLGSFGDDAESRIGEKSEKKSQRDFALWKFSRDPVLGFDAAFGKGFPGWHIECSTMSEKYLGVPFDIHTGGIDHISVHHNNEIAQTEAATGKLLAHFWLHNEHLTIDKEKMAKSKGEVLSLAALGEHGVHSLAYRYWLLGARYSTRMDYSLDAVLGAQVAYEKLHDTFRSLGEESGGVNTSYKEKFLKFINDDLDTPKALALAWELVKDIAILPADKKATLLDFDRVLGLMLGHVTKEEVKPSEEVSALLRERAKAREAKDWAEADRLRKEIENKGFSVRDTDGGGQILTKF